MKKIALLFALIVSTGSLSAMVRAGVDAGPGVGVSVDDGYYNTWYGPGWYYGNYYYDYPTYYAWRRNYYYGGPYYWRYNNRWRDGRRYHH